MGIRPGGGSLYPLKIRPGGDLSLGVILLGNVLVGSIKSPFSSYKGNLLVGNLRPGGGTNHFMGNVTS